MLPYEVSEDLRCFLSFAAGSAQLGSPDAEANSGRCEAGLFEGARDVARDAGGLRKSTFCLSVCCSLRAGFLIDLSEGTAEQRSDPMRWWIALS